ncbi:leucine-rich repeat domain-containing protein [Gemmata massiliana]|uniref:hypothetical protein n=1 Tax=Gemmata massiliana TaxID=1210884 RepID=UPI0013A6A28F|nr:hypothetical protein [Gemmata massiliana]
MAAKEKELTELKAKLLPFEHEDAAIRELIRLDKKANLSVQFSVPDKFEGLKVSIGAGAVGEDGKIDWSTLPRTTTNPAVRDALIATNRIRVVKGLRLQELTLTPGDLTIATQHGELETLVIQHAKLEGKALVGLQPLGKLNRLDLSHNQISSFADCPKFPSVKSLTLKGNHFGDTGIESLVNVFPNLQHLDLEGTEVSDDGMNTIGKLPELYSIRLRHTRVTSQGLIKILDCPKLNSVLVNKEQITDQVRAVYKQKRSFHQLESTDPRAGARAGALHLVVRILSTLSRY